MFYWQDNLFTIAAGTKRKKNTILHHVLFNFFGVFSFNDLITGLIRSMTMPIQKRTPLVLSMGNISTTRVHIRKLLFLYPSQLVKSHNQNGPIQSHVLHSTSRYFHASGEVAFHQIINKQSKLSLRSILKSVATSVFQVSNTNIQIKSFTQSIDWYTQKNIQQHLQLKHIVIRRLWQI